VEFIVTFQFKRKLHLKKKNFCSISI